MRIVVNVNFNASAQIGAMTQHDTNIWPLVGLFLGACGGDTGGGGTTPPIDYTTQLATEAGLQASWSGITVTDPVTLPAGGSANFAGIMLLNAQVSSGTLDMAGTLNLTANFAASTISGLANQFVDENNMGYAGSLALTNGTINRAADTNVEYTFRTDLTGTLSGAGDVFSITGLLFGDFLGPASGAVSGPITGTATSNFDTGFITGSFIAE